MPAKNTSPASTLKGKNVLITAGPTRVYLDPIRFISNLSSGQLGLEIATAFHQRNATVTVIYGPGTATPPPMLNVIHIETPAQMLAACKKVMTQQEQDLAIFAAAVSDYVPSHIEKNKIRSGKNLTLTFKPFKKIIQEVDSIPRQSIHPLLKVGFKLETVNNDPELIDIAYQSMLTNRCQWLVANRLHEVSSTKHRALLIDTQKNYSEHHSKKEIAEALVASVEHHYTTNALT